MSSDNELERRVMELRLEDSGMGWKKILAKLKEEGITELDKNRLKKIIQVELMTS